VLGPILFLVFNNKLDVLTELLTVVNKFADDTKLGQVIRTNHDREAFATKPGQADRLGEYLRHGIQREKVHENSFCCSKPTPPVQYEWARC
jgi:hypothetical protein